eukprot:721509-Rhodomonas_salina.1
MSLQVKPPPHKRRDVTRKTSNVDADKRNKWPASCVIRTRTARLRALLRVEAHDRPALLLACPRDRHVARAWLEQQSCR